MLHCQILGLFLFLFDYLHLTPYPLSLNSLKVRTAATYVNLRGKHLIFVPLIN